MKRFLLISSAVLFAISLSSCSKDAGGSERKPTEPTEEDRYYVKYEASDMHYLQQVSVNTESGTQRFEIKRTSYSQIFGPVKKGFTAGIVVAEQGAAVSIYVCKGEEPFALKRTGSTSASYVIDF